MTDSTAGTTDPQALLFREHAGPVLAALCDGEDIAEPELSHHLAEPDRLYAVVGAEVREILGTVGGIQDAAHQARLDKYREGRA